MDKTLEYYEQNAEAFERDTAGISMEHLYKPFLELIPHAGRILDAGCGPGRDSKAFLDLGYQVEAFDASARMVELAEGKIGHRPLLMRFEDVEFESLFDGVWASASLLHVPRASLADAVFRLLRAARSGGVLYMSFKWGTGERVEAGRLFVDFTEDALGIFLRSLGDLDVLQLWRTGDGRPGREQQQWVNGLVRKA